MIPLLALLLAPLAPAAEAPDDPLLAPLVAELERNVAELSLPEAPPIYHARYKVLELEQVDAQASLGSLVETSTDPLRMLFVEVRVGEPSFDNTGFGGWQNGFQSTTLPVVEDPDAVRTAAWRITDRAYKQAVEQFARKEAQFAAPEDYPGDYTLTGPVVGDEGTSEAAPADPLRELARTLSAALAVEVPEGAALELGMVHLGHEAGSQLLIDTEGTRLRLPDAETTLRASVHLRTADGMLLTDQRLFTVRQPGDLPPTDDLVAQVRSMAESLASLAAAGPLEDEYVGPVVFEGDAARDLFRYLLVPQLQGTPPEVPFDAWFGELGRGNGNTVRLKRRVLPLGWRVTDDPTRDPTHPGAFAYDAEGTPAQATTLVEDGIVQDLLMSRVPRQGLSGTNGHARGGLGARAQGMASQVAIQPRRSVNPRRLDKKAFRIASAYDRDFVLVVRRLQDPASRGQARTERTWMDPDEPQLPPPVEVIKRYADGREVRLRGAQFAGVQRFVLRDIAAAGPIVEGSYMASTSGEPWTYGPTEGLPTWLSAPEVVIGEMEIVPAPGDARQVPVVPPPALAGP